MQSLSKSISNHGSSILKALLFLLVIYCPFFLHLGDLPVRVWDEARLIANTLEMEKNGNYLVTHFDGKPEMWNTKPPLMIWCQLFFLKLIGNEEISFRLPSAIAGFLTALMIMLVSVRYLKSYWFGLITTLVLVTANGYIGDHVARTGDYDSLLTFFMLFYALCFFLYLETGRQQYLHLFFAGLAFSILTKSIQGLLFLPALGIYVIFTGNLYKLLKNRWVYIDFTLVLTVVMTYYLLRESVNPGYLKAVFINEIGERYFGIAENRRGFHYYLNLLASDQFGQWFLFVPLGFFAGLTLPKGKLRNLILFFSTIIVIYLLIISNAGTKLAWYDAPLYPLLSILTAFAIYKVFLLISEFKVIGGSLIKKTLPVLFLLTVFYLPYQNIISRVYKPREIPIDNEFYCISHLLQDAVNGKADIQDCFICYSDYNVHLQYYTNKLNAQGRKVIFLDTDLLKEGNNVICSQDNVKKEIEEKYFYEETGSYYNVKFLKINGIRNSND